jgi:signal peptidase I
MTKTRSKPQNSVTVTWFQVSGNCMAPLIRENDLVAAMPPAELRLGDIVVVSTHPVIVHRVVKILKGNYILTKGDLNLGLDSPCTKSDLAWKVTTIVRKEPKTIVMKGWLWRVRNYLMARYSLACFLTWQFVSRNRRLVQICQRFSSLLKCIYMCVPRVMTAFAVIKQE